MDAFSSLPGELLIEIFDFLPPNDILSLSLTCKAFNAIVTSTRISSKLEINFSTRNVNCEWIQTRNVTRAFLDGEVAQHFIYILALVGSVIEELSIDCHAIEIVLLKQILLMCGNVKKLWVFNVVRNSDERDYKGPLPTLDLDLLYFQGEIGVFRLLKQCKALTLDVRRDYEDECRNVDGLKHFLTSQSTLKNLSLENFDRNSSIFSENLTFNFRLAKLKVKYFDDFNHFFFREFLESQKDSLTHLDASQVHHDFLSLFRKFKRLTSLRILNICSSFDPIPSVESLEIKEVDGRWCEKFPNLKQLSIIGAIEEVQQVERLKHLEGLKIRNCEMPEIKIPTVKSLTVTRVSLTDTTTRLFDMSAQIEELKVDKCTNLAWLFEFLAGGAPTLKLLTIRKSLLEIAEWEKLESFESEWNGRVKIVSCQGITEDEIENDLSDYSDEEELDEPVAEEEVDEEAQEAVEGRG